MKIIKSMLPYLLVLAVDFYLLPLLITDTGLGIMMMLVVMPLICIGCSIVYGSKQAFHWQYPILAMVLFLPTVFLYYNISAWVYVPSYAIAALVGNLIGSFFRKS